jgi:hypothetical protein
METQSIYDVDPNEFQPPIAEEPIVLQFNISKLNGADWMTILDVSALVEAQQAGEKPDFPARLMQRYYQMIERVLVGGMEQIPFEDIPKLSLQFMKMISQASNPKDANGKN